jgi:predicted  nucleic acid-binding Zn-ribbon protein
MAGPAAILRELHRLRRHAKDLQTEIERGPRTLKAHEGKVARQEDLVREAHEEVKRLKLATHDKELSLKTRQEQIAKHERQRNEVTSKKEYDALQAEIDSDKRACVRLEDEILDAMAATEAKVAQLPEVERSVQRAKEEAARTAGEIQARRNALAGQLKDVELQLGEVEATLPDEVRATYRRLLAARGEDALAPVQGRTCVACYTDITAQNYNELAQGQFVVCKSCGRILYLPE